MTFESGGVTKINKNEPQKHLLYTYFHTERGCTFSFLRIGVA